MDGEPQPVIGWKNIIGFLGWLLLAAGAFAIIIGCGNLTGHPCSVTLISRSFIMMGIGATLLGTQWILWGEEDPGVKSTRRSRLRKALLWLVLSPVIALVIALLAVLGGG